MRLGVSVTFIGMLLAILTNAIGETLLTKAQATQRAEDFIALNGYTDRPAARDASQIVRESLERGQTIDEILRDRHNTLEPKAYGALAGRTGGRPGWTVVFRYRDGSREVGRAVTMAPAGTEIRVEHQDIFLAAVDAKSRPGSRRPSH